jgi:pimeloyl-ACP methyl ester carboxylesterase
VTVTFRSPFDGSTQRADVHAPAAAGPPLPLVVAPHPIGWTAAEDYHGGLAGLKRGHHPGWHGLAVRHRALIAQPHGHGRVEPLASCAFDGQIEDMAFLVTELPRQGFAVDARRVYLCGLSMAALESLVALGRHPDRFAAAFVFNPIVNLAAWYVDLRDSPLSEIKAYRTWERIAREVGGDPERVPDAYRARSADAYVDTLVGAPCMIYWTRFDVVVPRQATNHALRLYEEIKRRAPASPVAEYEHTASHGIVPAPDDWEAGWRLHEYCDYDLALAWLLRHQHLADPPARRARA